MQVLCKVMECKLLRIVFSFLSKIKAIVIESIQNLKYQLKPQDINLAIYFMHDLLYR